MSVFVNLRVWVGFFGVDTVVFDDVGEALVHEAAVAAHVSLGLGAVDQVLLGKRDKLASLLEVGALSRADR